MQFDERKRKLIISEAICSANFFSAVNLQSPDSIQKGEEEDISGCKTDNFKSISGLAIPVTKSLSRLLRT
jgi:hypothetical protein